MRDIGSPTAGSQPRRRSPSTYELVDSTVSCVLTRVHLRRPWTMLRMWWLYRQVRVQSRDVPGLRVMRFLVEAPSTFVILSIWDDDASFLDFGTVVTSHPPAVREALRRSAGGRQLEVWSTEWRLHAVSNNIEWEEFKSWAVDRTAPTASGSNHRPMDA